VQHQNGVYRLQCCEFNREVLTRGLFNACSLVTSSMVEIDGSNGRFVSCDFTGADLTRAHLLCADLKHSILRNSCLVDADLTATDLSDCDLRMADLSNAKLSATRLWGADLRGAVGLTQELILVAALDARTQYTVPIG
jgi:uncharacterized protein YjbI with pentapeptide repeats